MPSLPAMVPRLGDLAVHDSQEVPGLLASLTTMTRHTNYLGLPALVVPCGFSDSGLPASLQIVGRPFREDACLTLGQAYQSVTRFHDARPPILARSDGEVSTSRVDLVSPAARRPTTS
jgi:aspartyl-tRNA(Asn)/glutamyl-tRNA(Gln) amidotransferase subunit A